MAPLMFSVSMLLFASIHCAYSASWGPCTDLTKVKATVKNMDLSDIKSSLNVDDNAVVIVTSAQCQTSISAQKVALNIGPYQNVTVQYALLTSRFNPHSQAPNDVQLLSKGALRTYTLDDAYHEVTDLSSTKAVVKSHDSDIRKLLKSEQLSIGFWDKINVISAQNGYQQAEERGSHYRVTINVASYSQVRIQYFIPVSSPVIFELILIDLGLYDLQSVDVDSKSLKDEFTPTMIAVIASVVAAVAIVLLVCCICYVKKKKKGIEMLDSSETQKESLEDELLSHTDNEV